MADEDDFRIRPGRIRSTKVQRARPFIAQALAAAQKAGGHVSRSGRVSSLPHSSFGRGRVAAVRANRLITSRTRGAVIKARVVRHRGGTTWKGAPLARHLGYLQREGVTRDGDKGKLFGPERGDVRDEAPGQDFAERCEGDRHHFRFIVSPDDAIEMADLKGFARELMGQMETDLGTRLDWVAVDHWNTGHPHVHVIVRGVAEDGQDLVISRDYIREGLRARAQELITQELGLRTDLDIRKSIERQIDAERFTRLDRQLVRDAGGGILDVTPRAGQAADEFLTLKVGRLRKLEGLGLAEQVAPGQWTLSDRLEPTLRELGERGDIIKRLHRALTDHGIERGAASYVLAGENLDTRVVGRLMDRGLDDELNGSAFAVIDGLDGRAHHIRLPDIDAAGDGPTGAIVELRRFEDRNGRARVMLAVRSDLSIEGQITADGATWLDRQLIAREPMSMSETGFGGEVRDAMTARTDHLIEQGLARPDDRRDLSDPGRPSGPPRLLFQRNLLTTLRQRELDAVGERLAGQTELAHVKAETGNYVTGTFRQRLDLASGRFAMIDDGLGFQLVPWSPSLEKHLGRHVSGVTRDNGGVDWSMGRKRGLGL